MSERENQGRRNLRARGVTFGEPVSIDLEVPFYEVDPLGIVWHGHYFKYFERARIALLRHHDLDAGDFRGLSRRVLVVETGCRHLYPLTYADRFRVTAYFSEVEARLRIGYALWNISKERKAARAFTTLVITDDEGNLTCTARLTCVIRKRSRN